MLVACELIAETKIHWNEYLRLTKQVLDRNLSQAADRLNKPIGSLADFVCTLDELETNWSDLIKSLTRSPDYLEHLSFTFLILADKDVIYRMVRKSNCHIVETGTTVKGVHLAIVTGTLLQWKDAVISNLYMPDSNEIQILMNKIIHHFDLKGLSTVFSEYERQPDGDNKFLLSPRK